MKKKKEKTKPPGEKANQRGKAMQPKHTGYTTTPEDKDTAIYEYIKEYIIRYQYPPSYQDIADHVGCVVSTVHERIKSLQKKGLLEVDEQKRRKVRVPALVVIEKEELRKYIQKKTKK